MDLLKLNKRKYITIGIIWLIVSFVILWCLYNNDHIGHNVRLAKALKVALAFCAFYALLILTIVTVMFYRRNKILFQADDNCIINMFDNKSYSVLLENEQSFFLPTVQKLQGCISGYPVIVSVNIGRSSSSIEFKFSVARTSSIYQGKTDRPEILRLNKFGQSRQFPYDISSEVAAFIAKMKEKGDKIPDTVH